MKTYWIDEQQKNNLTALLEEVEANGKIMGPDGLYGWYLDNCCFLRDMIDELEALEAEYHKPEHELVDEMDRLILKRE